MVDARLADGSRVNIVFPPLVLNGGTISIRKFSKQNITLETMVRQGRLPYSDEQGELNLPLPRLAGRHQTMNAALAVAMLRHQDRLRVPGSALTAAMGYPPSCIGHGRCRTGRGAVSPEP